MQWAEFSVSVVLRCDSGAEHNGESPYFPRPWMVTAFLLVKRRTKSSDTGR